MAFDELALIPDGRQGEPGIPLEKKVAIGGQAFEGRRSRIVEAPARCRLFHVEHADGHGDYSFDCGFQAEAASINA